MAETADSVIESIRGVLTRIEIMLTEQRDEWENYLPAARSTTTCLDEFEYFGLPDRLAEQRWFVEVLQDYAFHDSDDGSIQDIADWCQASWLRILCDHPDDVESLTGSPSPFVRRVEILQIVPCDLIDLQHLFIITDTDLIHLGLGHNWLQRSQATLAKIHREEGSGSSSGSSNPGIGNQPPIILHHILANDCCMIAAQRAQTPLFVEARGYLQPAVDFFCRAVSAAEQNNSLTGKLLASVSP